MRVRRAFAGPWYPWAPQHARRDLEGLFQIREYSGTIYWIVRCS
jgi:hypothetical protein